jgi:hypothetical protein
MRFNIVRSIYGSNGRDCPKRMLSPHSSQKIEVFRFTSYAVIRCRQLLVMIAPKQCDFEIVVAQ